MGHTAKRRRWARRMLRDALVTSDQMAARAADAQAERAADPAAYGCAALLDTLVWVHGAPPLDIVDAVADPAPASVEAPPERLLCPFCGAWDPRACDITGECPWIDTGAGRQWGQAA